MRFGSVCAGIGGFDLGLERAGMQSWRNPVHRWGRYGARNQYVYCCPDCAGEAHPYYYPAATAIDWSIPGERIGDRARPLHERTMERIRYGLEKFGRQAMTVQLDYTHSSSNRAWPVTKALPTQTSRQVMALIAPFLIQYYTRYYGQAVSGIDQALLGVNTLPRHALIQPPFLTSTNYFSDRPRGVDEEMPTQTTGEKIGIAVPPFTVELYRTSKVHKIDEPLSTMTAGGIHQGLIVPFLTSYYGTENAGRPVTDPTATVTTVDRQALVEAPSVEVEDCFFRMLKPHEIGRAMAFPDDYIVLGSSRDKVRQYGNAVTPPVMSWIIQQVMRVLR